jgi:hypothetical protein
VVEGRMAEAVHDSLGRRLRENGSAMPLVPNDVSC